MSLKIIGTGKGIPEKSISNDDLTAFLETSDEWIFSRTGIKSRHICTTETLTDLSSTAALQALQKADMTPGDIDLIICSTIGGDYRTPSLACCLSQKIGAQCPAFDMNAACTGFIYALDIASGFLSRDKFKNILIVCAEIMSAQVDWNDRNTCVLFGDGAAACVVTKGNALNFINLSATADPSILNLPNSTGNSPFVLHPKSGDFLFMQGQEVFKFALNTVENEINQALHALKISTEQIDYFLLHQANKRIIDAIRNKLRLPEQKFPINIESYGNISSVSIPLLLFEMLESNQIKSGDVLLMSAFGAGLTSGCCVMTWE